MKKRSITRYIVTDIVSIPVTKVGSKTEAYRIVTGAGWGVVEWYSANNDYKMPVNRDKTDKTQVMICDEDTSASLYTKAGREFYIAPGDEVNLKNAPRQADTAAMLISGSYGYNFWAIDDSHIKIFVTYTEKGLIDECRLDSWLGKPCEGETEITFSDLQSEADHDNTDRADIPGTFEFERRNKEQATENPAADRKEVQTMLHNFTDERLAELWEAEQLKRIQILPIALGDNVYEIIRT
ncbi:MAG: hypothetical protein FWF80_00490, partial [Defluviitaleaceae bacterium]|nr:hypothetical protein [Defluviitaleaceae bacterium]